MQEDSCENPTGCGCGDCPVGIGRDEEPSINMGNEKVPIDLNPEAPNMKRLLELVSKAASEAASSEAARQVVASLKFYGMIPYDVPEERALEVGKRVEYKRVDPVITDLPGGLQLDMSGPVPKLYSPGKIGWKDEKKALEKVSKEGPSLKDILDKLDPQDVERIEIVSLTPGEALPPEVLKEIEQVGMAMADKLGKDRFTIVAMQEDENGKLIGSKEYEYNKKANVKVTTRREKQLRPTIQKAKVSMGVGSLKKKAHRGNLNFRDIDPVENRRVYIFPNNQRIIVENATKLAIADSGVHRLETANGEKYVIPTGWLGIKINSKAWPF